MAWPFLEPVNADEVPEYYDVIKEPVGECSQCLSRHYTCFAEPIQ